MNVLIPSVTVCVKGLMYCVKEYDGANLRMVGTNMAHKTSMDLTTSLIGHVSFWCVK